MKYLILLAVLAHICVGTEFTAFCEICRAVNSKTECPADLSCPENDVIAYDGIVSTCRKGHIITLKATNQGLSTLPSSVNEMTYLEMINIAANKFKELPTLDALTSLKTVYIHGNKLENITGVFAASTKLEVLSASNNELKELPPEFAEMKKLKNLNVANNKLSSIPAAYANMEGLTSLDISQNMFNCSEVKKQLPETIFAEQCIQSQQKIDEGGKSLPLSYSGEPKHGGLDAYEIAAIVLAVVFVILLVVAIVLYTLYRRNGLPTLA